MTAKRVNVGERSWRRAKDGPRGLEASKGVTRIRVVGVEGMTQSVSPEGFWDQGLKKSTTENVANGSIGAFGNAIQLRSVRWTCFMSNTIVLQIGRERLRHVFPSVICTKGVDFDGKFTFEGRLKVFEIGEDFAFEFDRMN